MNNGEVDGNKAYETNESEADGNRYDQKGNNDNGKKKSLAEMIAKRNNRLVKLFEIMELPVRIQGDENSPSMVYDDRFVLNAFVHNFELRFTDAPINGQVIYTIKLLETPQFDINRVKDCIYNYTPRYINKVYLNNTSPRLYLVGYNYLNKYDKLGRYPVFAANSPKCFFSSERAIEVMNELEADGYDCSYQSME